MSARGNILRDDGGPALVGAAKRRWRNQFENRTNMGGLDAGTWPATVETIKQ